MITASRAKKTALDCFAGLNARDIDRAVGSFGPETVCEFVGAGPPQKVLHGRTAIVENFEGWWAAFPHIQSDVIGVTVDSSWPGIRKEVSIEWSQISVDPEGISWHRRGITVFVMGSNGTQNVRGYLPDLFDPSA